MTQYDNIQKAMKVDIAITPKMAEHLYLWSRMYTNEAPWLNDDVRSLNLPASICTEMSRLVTMEMEYKITGSKMADLISEQFKKVYYDLPRYVEYACSTGGIVFKPYMDNGKIAVDYAKAGDFYPVSFDSSGEITACIFPEFKQKGKKLYIRLEYHSYDNNCYTIINKAFVSNKALLKYDTITNLGKEIDLSKVAEWASLEPYVELNNADGMLFSYFKIPIANNIDISSPLGVSVYSRSANLIRDADEQYGATLWEYRSKETAIQAADEFFKKDRNGKVIFPKGKEKIYHAMGTDISKKDGQPFFNAYSPDIRDESFFRAYNKIVRKIEFNSGLAYGTLSDPQQVEKTAEEIKSSKQRSYATVKAIQNSLEGSLNRLIHAMSAWAIIGDLAPAGNIEVGFDWDDSLVVDKKTDREQDRIDVSMGVMRLEEYRAKHYGETIEQAKKNLPEQADISDVLE